MGRALEFEPRALPDYDPHGPSKQQLFALCLQGLGHVTYTEDFIYVMSALLKSTAVNSEQFGAMSRQLLQGAENAGIHDCGAFFDALASLVGEVDIGQTQEACNLFCQLILTLLNLSERMHARENGKWQAIDPSLEERRVCWDGSECTFAEFKEYYKDTAERCWHMSPSVGKAEVIPGFAKCLHMLTKRIGRHYGTVGGNLGDYGRVAEQLMTYHTSMLQVTCSRGSGLDEDSLGAIGSLADQLGIKFLYVANSRSPLWPLLLHGVGEPGASSADLATWELKGPCKASLLALCKIFEAVGSDFMHCGYAFHARDNLLNLLRVSRLHCEVRPLGVKCLGKLVLCFR